MTQEEFINYLDENFYTYEIKGDKIVVTHYLYVDLRSLTSLPPGVEFYSKKSVDLRSLKSLPPGTIFGNGTNALLASVTRIPPGVEFNNLGVIDLSFLIGGDFKNWEGNIRGIRPKTLLNKMISLGLFDKEKK